MALIEPSSVNCPPPHPALLLNRPMTGFEMVDCLRYEGMWGIGEMDLPLARELARLGMVLLEEWDRGRGWHVCTLEARDA